LAFATTVTFVATLASAPAFAQREDAQRAMEAGVAASQRGEHEAALERFQAAQRLLPEANLPWRFAAESLEALGRWEEAVESYEAYLRVRPNVKDAAKIRERIDDLRAHHLEGLLDVSSNPPASAVFLDGEGEPLGETPLRDVRLRAGPHTVRVRFLGYRDAVLTTSVTAGSKVVLQCELERLPAAPSPVAAPAAALPVAPAPREAARPSPWYGRWYVWAGAGAALVGGVVTTAALAGRAGPPATQGGTHSFPDAP